MTLVHFAVEKAGMSSDVDGVRIWASQEEQSILLFPVCNKARSGSEL